MTEGVTDGRFKVGAWYVSEDRNTPYDGSTKTENPHNERTRIRVPLLTVDARFSDQVGIQAAVTIPDVTRTATNFRETFSGLGDTSIIGWYRLRPIRRWYVVVNVGASLPTGKTEPPRFRSELQDGDLVPLSRLQRGSGTFDPLFGASVTRVKRPVRGTKNEPSSFKPGENLRAPAPVASVWRVYAPVMSGARVMDWLTESPPKSSCAVP